MSGIQSSASSGVVVLGDLVRSRAAAERATVHQRLADTLQEMNRIHHTDLRITVGDEYQGHLPDLGVAATVTLAIRVRLLPDADIRHGIGIGATSALDTAGIEDGPGWWAARDAIDEVERLAETAALRGARTGLCAAPDSGSDGPGIAAWRSALLARDELVGRLDGRSLSVLRGLLEGVSQREIAEQLDVSSSAVSQRVRRDGLGVIMTVTDWLREAS